MEGREVGIQEWRRVCESRNMTGEGLKVETNEGMMTRERRERI